MQEKESSLQARVRDKQESAFVYKTIAMHMCSAWAFAAHQRKER